MDAAPVASWPQKASLPLVWAAFAAAHLWLAWLNLGPFAQNFSDVSVLYRFWAEQALSGGSVVAIDEPFVYPILALVPILASAAFGPELYGVTWLGIVTALDLAAFATIVGRRGRRGVLLGLWWAVFLFLLGPIALGRIDAVTVPIAAFAVAWIASRPQLAVLLLTVGAWIKVWPAAIVATLFIASADRLRAAVTAVGVSLAILVVALAAGSGAHVLSFITAQTSRGLQVEAPVTTVWLWLAAAGRGNAAVYYDTAVLTYQVTGQGADVAAALMTPLLVLAVVLVCALGVLAWHRGIDTQRLLGPLALALVSALIAFNKVGSPQFMTWLVVPVLLGLATSAAGRGVAFRTPAALVLAIAALTQLIYPLFYPQLLALEPVMLVVLTVRNVLLLVLFGWALTALTGLIRGRVEEGTVARVRVPEEA